MKTLITAVLLVSTAAAADQAVWSYDQASEKNRFLDAAGIDNELTAEEFATSAKADNGFARPFDSWQVLSQFDKNADGKISWLEADAYRQKLAAEAIKQFDADGENKLSEAEEAKLQAQLAAGRLPGALGARPDRGRGRRGRQPDPETLKKYDADGDGELSRQERRKAWQDRAEQRRQELLQKYDADKDGQLSDQEKQTARQDFRKRMQERFQERMVRRFDKDGDGQLNAEEQAAYDEAVEEMRQRRQAWRQRMEKRREEFIKKYDTDGDGELSDAERQAARQAVRQAMQRARQRFQEQADTDGDGEVSGQERQDWWVNQRKKYDANNDGKMDREEMRKMRRDMTGQDETSVIEVQQDGRTTTIRIGG